MNQEQILREILNALEEEEAKYLSWGYVDGGFDEEGILDFIRQVLERIGVTEEPDEWLTILHEQKLVMELPGIRLYRTRMAETVRLLTNLRQWMPRQSWRSSPTLVSDFRFHLRPRKYPARDQEPAQLEQLVSPILSETERQALHVLLDRKDRSGKQFQLSGFQIAATRHMIEGTRSRRSRGMIVCAGTGTGKTLSFYLPALTRLAGWVEADQFWTKTIAMYPRNELLKDQFAETFDEARRMDQFMLAKGRRKIRIGAFFGPTPTNSSYELPKEWKQSLSPAGYICPFFTCPKCKNNLIWTTTSKAAGIQELICADRDCGNKIGSDEIVFTRERMTSEPPDILFTTTEMLNRTLSDMKYGSIFGIRTTRREAPRLILLDEVHTYQGIHGAHVAMLLRRYRQLVGQEFHYTGLSATLEDAGEFFAQLTGLRRIDIEEVDANNSPLNPEGKEYQLILRGDPASQTSLLSTTIQSIMLISRMLEPSHTTNTTYYGRKTFVFTDDLDVTNRMYHNVLDAEGRLSGGQINPRKSNLAEFRGHNRADNQGRNDNIIRLREGQSWWFSEEIGHVLSDKLLVGRTSSQDAGVAGDADIIVATASLEVGFNDPEVGAVIQHKAPMDMASYLQRKGRAGRRRDMRPWMITVLSDYGRDRFAFQSFDTLFDPVLQRKTLPVRNRYVQRMQAVYSLIDWLSQEMHRISAAPRMNIWNLYATPIDTSKEYLEQRRQESIGILERLLQEKSYRLQLEDHLRRSLYLEESEITAIMWDPPRALMTAVIPTLLRRLEQNWKKFKPENIIERHRKGSPLIEFIPANLFSDLNLPEVCIVLPEFRGEREEELMSIIPALSTFAPGRVTRRFGVRRFNESHWIAPPSLSQTDEFTRIPIDTFIGDHEELGDFEYLENGAVVSVPCIRPWTIIPVQTTEDIKPTSNARLVWKTQIYPEVLLVDDANEGIKVGVPVHSIWLRFIEDVRFYTHQYGTAVVVRRFTIGSEATIRRRQQEDVDLSLRYSRSDGESVAVGFILHVDGVAFRFRYPEDSIISSNDPNEKKVRMFRTAFFVHAIKSDDVLSEFANIFQLERIAEVFICSLVKIAVREEILLSEAASRLANLSFRDEMNEVLQVIFQDLPSESEEHEDQELQQYQRLHQTLLELFEIPEIIERLIELAPLLWENVDDAWEYWARERWRTTLGAALLQACKEITDSNESDDLILDIHAGLRPDESDERLEIWVTETMGGGSGIVEELLRQYQADPKRFYRLVESALAPSDLELVDSELQKCLHLANHDSEVSSLFQDIRMMRDYRHAEAKIQELRTTLSRSGVIVTQTVMNAIFHRILKPGSGVESDSLMDRMISAWENHEIRLGIEIDSRICAYLFGIDSGEMMAVENLYTQMGIPQQDAYDRYQILVGLLWPRGYNIRTRALSFYNPFVDTVPTDRELLSGSIRAYESIPISDPNWADLVRERLVEFGTVRLHVDLEQAPYLRSVVLQLSAEPVDIGFLLVYPRVEGIVCDGEQFIATLEIREALQ